MLAWLENSTIVKTEDPLVYRQNKWYEPYSAPKTIAPFEAYLKYAPGKTAAGVRMITFEEADGTRKARPGYGLYDRALGATYLNGLWEAIEKGEK